MSSSSKGQENSLFHCLEKRIICNSDTDPLPSFALVPDILNSLERYLRAHHAMAEHMKQVADMNAKHTMQHRFDDFGSSDDMILPAGTLLLLGRKLNQCEYAAGLPADWYQTGITC